MNHIKMTQEITDNIIVNLINSAKQDSIMIDAGNDMVQRIQDYTKLGVVIAAIEGDTTFAIGGVGIVHSGLGTAWSILNKEFLKYPKTLLKFSRLVIKASLLGLNLHRIQMDIDTTFEENARFAKKLGFSFEGKMIQYGPNQEDYDRYVLIRNKM